MWPLLLSSEILPIFKCSKRDEPSLSSRQQIISPFLVTGQLGRFDVDAGVIGGGESGL